MYGLAPFIKRYSMAVACTAVPAEFHWDTQGWARQGRMLGPASIFTNAICKKEGGETVPVSPWSCYTLCLVLPNSALGGEVGFAGGLRSTGVAAGCLLAGAQDASAALLRLGACRHACPVGCRGCPLGVVQGLCHLAGQGDVGLCCSVLRAVGSMIWGAFLAGGELQRHQAANGWPVPPACFRSFWCFLPDEVARKPGPILLLPPAAGMSAATSLHVWHHTHFHISSFIWLYSMIKWEKKGFERVKCKHLNSQ